MINFCQFELDDLAALLEPLMRDSVEEMLDADERIVGYEVRRPDASPLREFLVRVVEVVDRNRARATKKQLTSIPAREHNPSRSTIT